jgi:hypothetical protein
MFRSRCHHPQHKPNSIEYSISSSQISFLLLPTLSQSVDSASARSSPCLHPALITLPSDAKLRMILSQKDFINLVVKHSSTSDITRDDNQKHNTAHFELQDKILDENT